MDYCLSAAWISFWHIGLSPTVVAALLASILAPWFAIKTYLKQQRVSRIQRIYYEESLLDLLKHLDNATNITSKNLVHFESAINLILNDFKIGVVTSSTIMVINEIAKKISSPIRYQSSKREVLITLFKNNGYILHQWLSKFDQDFSGINLFIREVLFGLAIKIQLNPRISKQTIKIQGEEIDDYFKLVMRHHLLPFLFNEIVSRVGTLDFKSREELIKDIEKDKIINTTLGKIDEAFKILFGYFKLQDKIFVSYLKDENENRFKLHITDQVSIDRIKDDGLLTLDQMRIIKDDMRLANVKIEVNGSLRNYSHIQIGIANLQVFDEKPKFYREVDSFDNFQ